MCPTFADIDVVGVAAPALREALGFASRLLRPIQPPLSFMAAHPAGVAATASIASTIA